MTVTIETVGAHSPLGLKKRHNTFTVQQVDLMDGSRADRAAGKLGAVVGLESSPACKQQVSDRERRKRKAEYVIIGRPTRGIPGGVALAREGWGGQSDAPSSPSPPSGCPSLVRHEPPGREGCVSPFDSPCAGYARQARRPTMRA